MILVGLILAIAVVLVVNALGVGAPYGEAVQLYSGVTVGGVETALTATNDASRAKNRFIQKITLKGSATTRYIRVQGPPATFQGQSWYILGKRDHTTQHIEFELPVQVFMPFDENLTVTAFDTGVNTVSASVSFTYNKVPWKQQGFFYTQLVNPTITGSTQGEDVATQKTVAMNLGDQTLMGMQCVGETQLTQRMNLRSSLWGPQQEDEFEDDDGPWCPGANSNFESDGVTVPLGEWKLADSRNYIPSVIGSAGDVWIVVHWQTATFPAIAAAP